MYIELYIHQRCWYKQQQFHIVLPTWSTVRLFTSVYLCVACGNKWPSESPLAPSKPKDLERKPRQKNENRLAPLGPRGTNHCKQRIGSCSFNKSRRSNKHATVETQIKRQLLMLREVSCSPGSAGWLLFIFSSPTWAKKQPNIIVDKWW